MSNGKGHKAPTLSGDERTAVAARYAQRYEKGETIREMAADSGRSYGAVHALLIEHGVRLRTRGWPRGRPNQPRTTEGAQDAYGTPDPEHDVGAELARYEFTKESVDG